VAISHGITLEEGSVDGWFPLGEVGHVPHQLDLDGRVDLNDLVLLLVALSQGNTQECFRLTNVITLSFQWPSVMESH
jgi:hypothetical protein